MAFIQLNILNRTEQEFTLLTNQSEEYIDKLVKHPLNQTPKKISH